mgnify:CR=1 FL=1
MSGTPSVSVVVTNFDGENYLPGMMAALEATRFPFHEIIVSDDASTDGSRLLVRHRYPGVRLVASDSNLGPAAARNAGIRAASGEFVLLLDNDGFPRPDAVEPMLDAFERDKGIVGVMPRVILRGDPALVHCDGARTHVTGQMWLLNGHVPLATAPATGEPIASLMGTAMMFRREAALAIGGFEPDYFFYYEDHDFGTRLRILGGPLASVPSARIDHLTGTAGLSFRTGRRYPLRRAYLTAKNRVLFTLRTLRGRTLLLLLPGLVLHELAQAAFAIARGWGDCWLGGWTWNVSHLGRTLRKREVIQARRIAPDRAILQDGALPLHPGVLDKKGPAARIRVVLERVLGALYVPVRRFIR